MGVSKNNGTPKSSILIRFSIINHPFWGTSIFGNPHIVLSRFFLLQKKPGVFVVYPFPPPWKNQQFFSRSKGGKTPRFFCLLRSGDHWDNENRYEVPFLLAVMIGICGIFMFFRLKRWGIFCCVCYEHILYQQIPILKSKYTKLFENSNPLLQVNRRQLQPVFIRQGWGSGEWSELRYCPRVIEAQQKHLQLLMDAGELHLKSKLFLEFKRYPKVYPVLLYFWILS